MQQPTVILKHQLTLIVINTYYIIAGIFYLLIILSHTKYYYLPNWLSKLLQWPLKY